MRRINVKDQLDRYVDALEKGYPYLGYESASRDIAADLRRILTGGGLPDDLDS